RHADAGNDEGPGRFRHGALSGSAVAVSALGGTRTPNLLIRSQMLSPIELRAPVAEEQAYRGRRRAPNRHLPPGRPPRRPDAPSRAWLAWPATTAAAEGGVGRAVQPHRVRRARRRRPHHGDAELAARPRRPGHPRPPPAACLPQI